MSYGAPIPQSAADVESASEGRREQEQPAAVEMEAINLSVGGTAAPTTAPSVAPSGAPSGAVDKSEVREGTPQPFSSLCVRGCIDLEKNDECLESALTYKRVTHF